MLFLSAQSIYVAIQYLYQIYTEFFCNHFCSFLHNIPSRTPCSASVFSIRMFCKEINLRSISSCGVSHLYTDEWKRLGK